MPAVLITGASRGFGRALFDVYVQRGWITFPLVRDADTATHLERLTGARCHPIVANVTSDQVEQQIAEVLERARGPLDVLINNAGQIKKLRGLDRTSTGDLEELFRVHCVGAFRCTRASLPFLARAEQPVVVNISSRWGSISRTVAGKGGGIYAYQIAKCAQNMLSACLDHELRGMGIRVFAVHPGRLKTAVAAADADTDPDQAARSLADWIDQADEQRVCGVHDLMGGGLIDW